MKKKNVKKKAIKRNKRKAAFKPSEPFDVRSFKLDPPYSGDNYQSMVDRIATLVDQKSALQNEIKECRDLLRQFIRLNILASEKVLKTNERNQNGNFRQEKNLWT